MTTHSRQVVRKRLADDCLLHGQLHPSIAERLERVRELPVSSVATLIAVERDDAGVWMIWEFVPGQTLDEFLSTPRSALEKRQIAGELKRAVASLHASGIVHGALHSRNVIIDPAGKVHLTHISPLLFSDPADDQPTLQILLNRLDESRMNQTDAPSADSDSGLRRREYLKVLAAIVAGIVIFAAILWYIRG